MDACEKQDQIKYIQRKHTHSVLNSKVLRTCLAYGKIFENVVIFQETRKILPSFKEIHKDRQVFIYTDRFEVIHVRCFFCFLHIYIYIYIYSAYSAIR